VQHDEHKTTNEKKHHPTLQQGKNKYEEHEENQHKETLAPTLATL